MRAPGALALALAVWLSLALSGASLAASPQAQRTDGNKSLLVTVAGLPQGPLKLEMEDGSDFIADMVDEADELKDYSLDFQIIAYKATGSINEAGTLKFKKPKMMRIEETGDYKRGAVAVLRKDGKVRAHLGGALKVFVVTLPADSGELKTSHDYPMVKSDFFSLATYLQNWVKNGVKSRVSEDPIVMDGSARKVHVLEMFKENEPDTVLKRVFVDAHSKLPVEWHDFAGGKMSTRSSWNNVKVNAGLSDNLFDM